MTTSNVLPGEASEVSSDTPVLVFPVGILEGVITNPSNAPGTLYVNPTGVPAEAEGGGANFPVEPGGCWRAFEKQATSTSVASTHENHKFSAAFSVPMP